MPTMPLFDDGLTIEPSVSVPIVMAANPAAAATPDPELEPLGVRSRQCGFRVCLPRPLQPELERVERALAHSLRFVLPIRTAPARRSRATSGASRCAEAPVIASDPAVVSMRSPVSMLSLISKGRPWSGPRVWPRLRSASRRRAMSRASGLTSITLRVSSASTAAMRSRLICASSAEVSSPRASFRPISEAESSASSECGPTIAQCKGAQKGGTWPR